MASKHILIVDDEPRVAFFLGKTLERAPQDYRISTAKSGEDALGILRQSHVDLLVTDLRMPGISGLDLIRWVRASNPETRTILITAYGNDEVEREARRMKAYHYITKPFDIGDFTSAVEDALSGVAVSRPGFVVLSDEAFEKIAKELETLRYDTGSMCILLADMQGQRLVEVGNTDTLDVTTLLALLGGGFVTNTELARQFGEGEAANLNFHQGTRYEIYSATVGKNLFIALVYDRQTQPSRIGVVWLYARRAIESLLEIVESNEITQAYEGLEDDFGATLAAEMDAIFADDGAFATDAAWEPDAPAPIEDAAGEDSSPDALGGAGMGGPQGGALGARPAEAADTAVEGAPTEPAPQQMESRPAESAAPPHRRRSRWDAQELPDLSAPENASPHSSTPLLNLEQAMDEGLVNPELRRLLGMDEGDESQDD
jgi:DNA-binding response OmpR family regulator